MNSYSALLLPSCSSSSSSIFSCFQYDFFPCIEFRDLPRTSSLRFFAATATGLRCNSHRSSLQQPQVLPLPYWRLVSFSYNNNNNVSCSQVSLLWACFPRSHSFFAGMHHIRMRRWKAANLQVHLGWWRMHHSWAHVLTPSLLVQLRSYLHLSPLMCLALKFYYYEPVSHVLTPSSLVQLRSCLPLSHTHTLLTASLYPDLQSNWGSRNDFQRF